MTQFELVFKGDLVKGFAVSQAKENMAKLFKASEAQVEQMFSGRPVVLRNRLDDTTAKKYQAILAKNGALCSLRKMGNVRDMGSTGARSSDSGNQTVHEPTPKKKTETVTGLPVAGEKVDDILEDVHWDVAPTGSNLADEQVTIPLPEHDLSHLTVAPAGSDIGEIKKDSPPPPPDTSHLNLESEQ